MRSVVTGLLMLAGSVVREQGQMLDGGNGWREEARGGRQQEAARERDGDGDQDGDDDADHDGAVTLVRPLGGAAPAVFDGVDVDDDANEHVMTMPGDWDVACARRHGGTLMFDRQSVRVLGGVTLFRWAPSKGMPQADGPVYTAVADCGAKSIEASWPGKRTVTRAGTCGRHLVDAVCEHPPAVKH